MRIALLFLLGTFASISHAETTLLDIGEIEDRDTLEITVLQDWEPSKKHPGLKQKLIEITVCEWWEGQKVRLPVTLNAPVQSGPCKNLIIANQSLTKRVASPVDNQLALLTRHGVGVILIGMGTIDAMEPVGKLHLGMRQQLLKTKSPRYSPAWIWGMSQMRALTAAQTEPDVFQPEKVLTTGGSKRGIASAAAGIHDHRFTAIMPIVAPPLGNPGSPTHVMGTEPAELKPIDDAFYRELKDEGITRALQERAERRAANRISLTDAKDAKWSDADIAAISDRVWDASRTALYLPELQKRELDIFYNVGTNDSVSPALLELGKRFPEFPIAIIPGGQHGGPSTAGFTKRTPVLPEVKDNFTSFARSHFFGDREMKSVRYISSSFDRETKTLTVTTAFPTNDIPKTNTLWWNLNRSEPYTLPFEYDRWENVAMQESGPGTLTATIKVEEIPNRIDFLSVHTDRENDLTLTFSSPYRRIDFQKKTVALIGDSTVTDSAGWGKAFADQFSEAVTVKNFAVGGRSAKSWYHEGRLPAVRESMPDYLLIQFGHNGQPGKGPQRETDPATTYPEYLKIYIEEARKIGATPVLLSSVTRRDFTAEEQIRLHFDAAAEGATRPLKPWAEAAEKLAKEEGIAFIDLYQLSVDHHNKIGPEASGTYSPKAGDITHFNRKGAEAISRLIVAELKNAAPNLASFLKD
ncbi:MAG: GDSL-type esterase/lipase family protein [Verrucomicrobiales bacterium]|nr:GDSL-type esterase/lipase family protein [Verrucomicrobiales bacterium]